MARVFIGGADSRSLVTRASTSGGLTWTGAGGVARAIVQELATLDAERRPLPVLTFEELKAKQRALHPDLYGW